MIIFHLLQARIIICTLNLLFLHLLDSLVVTLKGPLWRGWAPLRFHVANVKILLSHDLKLILCFIIILLKLNGPVVHIQLAPFKLLGFEICQEVFCILQVDLYFSFPRNPVEGGNQLNQVRLTTLILNWTARTVNVATPWAAWSDRISRFFLFHWQFYLIQIGQVKMEAFVALGFGLRQS